MKKKHLVGFIFTLLGHILFSCGASAQGVDLPKNVGLPNPSGGLTAVISNFANWILGIFGFLAIISFVVSGIMYFMSAGDDSQQEKAKKQMTWSIIGVAIGLIGLVIIYAVDSLLRAGGS